MINFFDGFDRKEVTVSATAEVNKGKTVEFMDSYTVDRTIDGHIFDGVCTYVSDAIASIQIRGYTKVTYTGTAPSFGYTKLSSDGKGGVKADENGRYVLVTDVDTDSRTCGIIL